jgi:hypothetical protein
MKTTLNVSINKNHVSNCIGFERVFPYAGIPLEFLDGFHEAMMLLSNGEGVECDITISIAKDTHV